MRRVTSPNDSLFDLAAGYLNVNEDDDGESTPPGLYEAFRQEFSKLKNFDPTLLPTHGGGDNLFCVALTHKKFEIAEFLLQQPYPWGTIQGEVGDDPLVTCLRHLLVEHKYSHDEPKLQTSLIRQLIASTDPPTFNTKSRIRRMTPPARTPLSFLLKITESYKSLNLRSRETRLAHLENCEIVGLAAFLVQRGAKISPIPYRLAETEAVVWQQQIGGKLALSLELILPVLPLQALVADYAENALGSLFQGESDRKYNGKKVLKTNKKTSTKTSKQEKKDQKQVERDLKQERKEVKDAMLQLEFLEAVLKKAGRIMEVQGRKGKGKGKGKGDGKTKAKAKGKRKAKTNGKEPSTAKQAPKRQRR